MSLKPSPEPLSNLDKTARRIKSEDLFEGRTEIIILHREEEYRLRITKSKKLILTK